MKPTDGIVGFSALVVTVASFASFLIWDWTLAVVVAGGAWIVNILADAAEV